MFAMNKKSQFLTNIAILIGLFVISITGYSQALQPGWPIDPNVQTTLQRTIVTDDLPSVSGSIYPCDVLLYKANGYGNWHYGLGLPITRRFDLIPNHTGTTTNTSRLLSFFAISDIHICDKESPEEAIFAAYHVIGGNSSAYSPIMPYTTQVLDAAIQTINALHKVTPFDLGISLGDACNDMQYNELRWYIDIIVGGKIIQPSSGSHLGASTVDYQKPYLAVGLDPSIPWYQVLGNHDHFWLGSAPVDAVPVGSSTNTNNGLVDMRASYTGSNVIMITELFKPGTQLNYAGVIDGSTPDGLVLYAGTVSNPSVMLPLPSGADPNRYALTRNQWISEFITSGTTVISGTNPVGHGFTQALATSGSACYSFLPKSNLPLKVIVLDDTDGEADVTGNGDAHGSLDAGRWQWLQGELAAGDSNNQLMIIAAHVPLDMQVPTSVTSFSSAGWLDPLQSGSNGSAVSLAALKTELHKHPNLIMWLSGHMHMNNVTPEPDPSNDPTLGFWEVETSSLRDLPQEFRTFQITANNDNTISIFAINVDPSVAKGSPAAVSRSMGAAAFNLFFPNGLVGLPSYPRSDFGPVNVELVKQLTPTMASIIRNAAANCGTPIGVLSSITVNGGTLAPKFNPSVTSYSGTVASSLTTVTATPWYSYTNPSIQLTANGVTSLLSSGTPSAPLSLNMGVNTFTVTVSSSTSTIPPIVTPPGRPGRPTPTPVTPPVRPGTTTYTLTLTRVPSSTPDLAGLTLDAAPIYPMFTTSGTSYSASVPNSVGSVTVTPIKANPTDTIAVSVGSGAWQSVVSGNPSGPLSLASSKLINVLVTGTGGSQKLYTITVNQLASPVTSDASGIDATTATLNAVVDESTPLVAFQYGQTADYGMTTSWEAVPVDFSNQSTTSVLAGIVGLTPSTLYHYRVMISTGTTTLYGADKTFVTVPDYSVQPIAAQGDAAPGISNAQFVSFGCPAINNLNNLAFQAVVTGSGITANNNHGIWAPNVSGSNLAQSLIVRTGQSTAYYSNVTGTALQLATFSALGDPVFDNNNRIAFIGTASTWVAGGLQQSIFAETTGTLIRIAGIQDQAPNCATGVQFSSFQQLVLPDQGGVVFVANLTTGLAGVTSANNQGLWLADSAGTLSLVVRTGDILVVGGARKTVAAISIFTPTAAVGAQTRSFNSSGTLVYTVTFTDGTQSIYGL